MTQGALTIALIAGTLGVAVYAVPHVGSAPALAETSETTDTSNPADPPLALPPGVDGLPGVPAGPSWADGSPTDEDAQLKTWADRLSHVGISSRALIAYGNAELILARTKPACHLSWTTLAGIGSVETNHGTTGGTSLGADGRPVEAIRGPALDGTNNNKLIEDTDGGEYDGDKKYDRAVGPMQFIPQTWSVWKADGDGDGVTDPNDIDDAALAAGHYLCADGRDLSRAAEWYAAIFAYNHLDSYVKDVYDRADAYGKKSKSR